MSNTSDVDVIIGGGGVAGAVSAAALQQIGFNVMLVEPGLHNERRLAGEVFHPPGVSGLAELHLLEALASKPAVSVKGFSVSSGHTENGAIKLPYDLVRSHCASGLSLDHGFIRDRLQAAARALPGISFRFGERVVGIDQSNPSSIVVQLANGKTVTRHRCRFLVAADGAISRIAKLAGIQIQSRRISTIFGYRVPMENLPAADYGHVFLGARTPILVYPISGHEARILFDVPYEEGRRVGPAECLEMSRALPPRLRSDAERAIAEQPRMSVLVQATNGERSVGGRVVLVGDAAGSCHPLTATGMTMCISDALMLRDMLTANPHDVRDGLLAYQSRRARPQITRLTLADALRDAFCASTPEWHVVRRGILAYWRASPRGRAATMALLSTADGRSLSLVYQMVKVMVYGLIANYRQPVLLPDGRPLGGARLVVGLLQALLHHVRSLLRIRPPMSQPENGGLAEVQGQHGKPD
jgi:squalene monooxygenase